MKLLMKLWLKSVFVISILTAVTCTDEDGVEDSESEYGEILVEKNPFTQVSERIAIGGKEVKGSKDALTKIRFFTYSSSDSNGIMKEIKIGELSTLRRAHLNPKIPFKIFTHGFMGLCSAENFPQKIIKTYQENNVAREYNLICVDWGPLSNQGGQVSLLLYRVAVDNAIPVAERIVEFVKYLMDHEILKSLKNIHFIGFSLGAHVAGTTGCFLQKFYKEKVGRITGLDPAGPFFDEEKNVEHKLDQTDAQFVDIIHTNGGKLGIFKKIGHVDFYPNGGRRQPQCEHTGDPTMDFEEAVAGKCSHYMAPKYFASTIGNSSRLGCKCTSWKDFKDGKCDCEHSATFGENCNSSSRGTFYLIISDAYWKDYPDFSKQSKIPKISQTPRF